MKHFFLLQYDRLRVFYAFVLASRPARYQRTVLLVFLLMAMGAVSLSTAGAAQAFTRWEFPCGPPFSIVKQFDKPESKYSAGHRGVDFDRVTCATVKAPASGTVSFVGVVVDRPVLSIKVSEDTVYSFEPVRSELKVGDTVTAGESIGSLGVGGHCESTCLHFGVRVHGEYVNPMRYFFQKPVLLPWRMAIP